MLYLMSLILSISFTYFLIKYPLVVAEPSQRGMHSTPKATSGGIGIALSILIFSILIVGYMMNYNYFFYTSLLITVAHLFFYQLKFFNSKDPSMCLKVFKSNNLVGLLIFCNILLGKF